MMLLADEGIDNPIVLALRDAGLNIKYIREIRPGMTDDEVLTLATTEQRILITQDKDFGELVFRLKSIHCGVILVRLEGYTPAEKALIVKSAFFQHQHELFGSFTVIQPNAIRIRK